MTSVLIAGMFPYIVYGIAVPLSRSIMTTIIGLAIIIAHVLLVLNERIIDKADYKDGMIYFVPIIIAVTVLPLVIWRLKNLESHKT